MAALRRLFQKFRSPSYFIGRDLEGNRFYEYPSVSDDARRTKRVVKYTFGQDPAEYATGRRRLPVQWSSWLTHTRPDAPSPEELQADAERQRRVLFNVSLLEARDREERARQIEAATTQTRASNPAISGTSQDMPNNQPGLQPQLHENLDSRPSPDDTKKSLSPGAPRRSGFVPPDAQARQQADEPQAWNPRTIRRGS